jgi:hypothetical protein
MAQDSLVVFVIRGPRPSPYLLCFANSTVRMEIDLQMILQALRP